jgi:tetratricopeptide (TPR) repeat protein
MAWRHLPANRALRAALVASALGAGAAAAQTRDETLLRLSLGANEYLIAGADSIRAQQYDDGIRLTLRGLEVEPAGTRNRAAGLANLCAAYVAKSEADAALPFCDQALELDAGNWRVYSNRSRAYFIKGMLREAAADNEAAAAVAPDAAHVKMMRGLLNERLLRSQVIVEEHE